jgi:flavorubredoxin
MPEVSKTFHSNEVEVSISEVIDGIYRIAGFVETYGITFNQFLIQDENPILIHTGPIWMYRRIQEKLRKVINLEKLAHVAFLHFESDEWWYGISKVTSSKAGM